MATVELDPHVSSYEYLDPDGVGLCASPLLKPMKINLEPSPSPPSPLSYHSPDSPTQWDFDRPKFRPCQGDAVLVSFMAGDKHARNEPVQNMISDSEDDEEREDLEGPPREKQRINRYWLPRHGIDSRVIAEGVKYFLGQEASVRARRREVSQSL